MQRLGGRSTWRAARTRGLKRSSTLRNYTQSEPRLRQAELQSQIATDIDLLAQVDVRLWIIEREGTMPADDVQIKRISESASRSSPAPQRASSASSSVWSFSRYTTNCATGSTPAIEQAATIVHHGAMDSDMPTIQTVACWIDANGFRSAGYNRELYIERVRREQEAWVTELQEPIVMG
jgi:hypothetical protein